MPALLVTLIPGGIGIGDCADVTKGADYEYLKMIGVKIILVANLARQGAP